MDCIAHQVPLSKKFSRQEYWSGLPFPSSGDLTNPGIEPGSPALQVGSLPSEPPWEAPKNPGQLQTAQDCLSPVLPLPHQPRGPPGPALPSATIPQPRPCGGDFLQPLFLHKFKKCDSHMLYVKPRAIHVGVDSAAAGGGRPPIKERTASRDPVAAEERLPGAGRLQSTSSSMVLNLG